MKRNILYLILLFVVNSVYSQQNEWYWNDNTKDEAYEAPTSKFAKKWISSSKNGDGYYDVMTINQNGTLTMNTTVINSQTGYDVPIKIVSSATWKRINKLTLQIAFTDIRYTVDKNNLAKIPARRRDEITKGLANANSTMKKKMVGTKFNISILRIDDDHLIYNDPGKYSYWASERLSKRLEKEEADKQAKEEAERQARETEEKEQLKNKVYDVVGEMPEYPGGPSAMFEYLSKNIQYPEGAKKEGIQGRVIVTIIIEKDGSITDAKVVKSLAPSLDREAQRLVESMPNWIPGKQNGEPVRVKYTVPVTFSLQ